MRIAILGDVHGNLEALNAVIAKVHEEQVDRWVQVGDVVGYGADPIACLELIRELDCTVCLGNHDAAVVGYLDTDYFNLYARQAIDWTREQMRAEDLDNFRRLHLRVDDELFSLVHGSLHKPEQFGYVLSTVEAADSMEYQQKPIAFVGHSHVPAIYMQSKDGPKNQPVFVAGPEMTADTTGFERVLVNVGSVGQPRDEDSRAAYAIFDSTTGIVRVSRVAYDIETAQQKIRAAGLPSVLADRLALGV